MSVQNTQRVVIGFYMEVSEINTLLLGYAPSTVVNGQTKQLPYNLEDIIGHVIKNAGSSSHEDATIYATELRFHLEGFDDEITSTLITKVEALTQRVRQLYIRNNWLDSYGSAPWRFNGFVNSFDIQIWRQ